MPNGFQKKTSGQGWKLPEELHERRLLAQSLSLQATHSVPQQPEKGLNTESQSLTFGSIQWQSCSQKQKSQETVETFHAEFSQTQQTEFNFQLLWLHPRKTTVLFWPLLRPAPYFN